MNYKFVPYEKVVGNLNINDINDCRNIYAGMFLHKHVEVVYVVENGRHLVGVVTPSDLDRLYYNEVSSPLGIINRKFSFVEECDFHQAEMFFKKYKKCHEIPVISNGEFVGVISDGIGKDDDEIADICRVVSSRLRMERDIQWYCEEIKRYANGWAKTNILVWGNLRDAEVIQEFGAQEKDALIIRKGLKSREVYERIIDNKWNGPGFFNDYGQIRFKAVGGVFYPQDMDTPSFHVSNNHRIITNRPEEARRRIFVFGPCNVFGAYVTDDQTIESHLQEMLNNSGITDVEVVNCGLMGPEKCLDNIFVTDISSNDVIIILTPGFDWMFKEYFPESYRGNLSDVYNGINNPTEHFLDNVRHCDGVVNKAVAKRIWIDLKCVLEKKVDDKPTKLFGAKYFIPPEVRRYFDGYMEEFFDGFHCDGKVGAIVMNCNPFTNGHRYLVEYASSKVDQLIIFVVEEDKSFFTFEQRFEMVKRGVEDISNVIVVPSGRYIISKETFAQYFEKENAIEVDDMDYDIYVFGDIVAKKLGISTRFLGKEPTDIVTNKYNERMVEILPSFEIDVEIIERKTDGEVAISGSRVRENFKNNDWEEVSKLCPESTVTILKKIKEKSDII